MLLSHHVKMQLRYSHNGIAFNIGKPVILDMNKGVSEVEKAKAYLFRKHNITNLETQAYSSMGRVE